MSVRGEKSRKTAGLKGISAECGGHEGGTAPLAAIVASCGNVTNSGAHFGSEKTDIQI